MNRRKFLISSMSGTVVERLAPVSGPPHSSAAPGTGGPPVQGPSRVAFTYVPPFRKSKLNSSTAPGSSATTSASGSLALRSASASLLVVMAGVGVRSLTTIRPSLEDTFVALTGEGFDVAR